MALFNSIGLEGVTSAAAVVLPERVLPTGVDALELPFPPATDDELVLDVGVDLPTVDGFGGNPPLFFAAAELFAGLAVGVVRIVVAVMLSGGRPPTAGGLAAVPEDVVGGTLIEVVVLAVALAPPVAGAAGRRVAGVSGVDAAGEFLVFGVVAGAAVLEVAAVVVVVLGLAAGDESTDFAPAAAGVAGFEAGLVVGVELRVVRLAAVGVALLVPELAVAVAVIAEAVGVVRMDVVVLAVAVARLAAAAAASAVLAALAALALLAATFAAVAALLAAAEVAVVDGVVVVDAGVSRVPAIVI